jgi:RIO-like serine/threonine protein kinase
MKLVKLNQEKNRSVYFDGTKYIKIWNNVDSDWIFNHFNLLKKFVPDYVIDYGKNWISYKIILGVPASEFPHNLEFVNRIYNFCLTQIESTNPWYHGDWALSNIIINGNDMYMIDWDNLGKYPKDEVYTKLNEDMKSAFGELFQITATR